MRTNAAIACSILALALAGCGAQASSSAEFEGEEKAVADVVEDLQAAGERKDSERICDEILSRALVEQVVTAGSSCSSEVDKSIRDADDFSLDVTDVTVTGATARATVAGKDGDRDRMAVFEFVKERGQWRASSLAARPAGG